MRTVLGVESRSSATENLNKLKYLNLQDKRNVHEAVFAYKAINKTQPKEISKKYSELLPTGKTRAATKQTINYPKHKTSLYEKSPLYRTITTWNKIPTEIKSKPATTFKKCFQKFKVETVHGTSR